MTFELIPSSTSQMVGFIEPKPMARCSAFDHSAIMSPRASLLPCVGSSKLVYVFDVLPHAFGISCCHLLPLALALCSLKLLSSSFPLIPLLPSPVRFAILLTKQYETWHPNQWLKMEGRRWSLLGVVLQAW